MKKNKIIEDKNKDITDSIQYAQGIQEAILPPDEKFKKYLPDSFILFRPRDIVSGDFYWMEVIEKINSQQSAVSNINEKLPTDDCGLPTVLFAVCDCTGHGVPGGFVSIVWHNGLTRTVNEKGIFEPAKILDSASLMVEETFLKGKRKDGMDVVLCSLESEVHSSEINTPLSSVENPALCGGEGLVRRMTDSVTSFGGVRLQFSAANNPLYIVRKKNLEILTENGVPIEADTESATHWLFQIKADKQPVGAYDYRKPFTNHCFILFPGDTIYLSSDGFRDQFGGPQGKKFMAKNFKQILVSIQEKSMEEQKDMLNKTIVDWMSGNEQNDDICIIGV